MNADTLLQLEQRLIDEAEPFAVVTVIRAAPPTSAWVGAQALVDSDGALHGWIGGGCSRTIVIEAARQAIRSGLPKRVRISNERVAPEADVEAHEMLAQRVGLRVSAAAHVTAPLAALGLQRVIQGFDADALNRVEPQLILVATQGDSDEDALEAALRSVAAAVLLVASRRKADLLREAMLARGITPARLAALHAPAGPAIHAHTPQEIALGAVAGLVTLRRELEQAGADVSASMLAGAETVSVLRPCESMASVELSPARYLNPVCGMAIDIASAKHVIDCQGQRVYFCCDGCKIEFERDPDRYLTIARGTEHKART
jgi:xanthine dehydrogenase accessory factor